MRKEFQVARERTEMRANSSMEKQQEMAQASMETDEGINSNINANDLRITNEVAINDTLPLEVVIESNSPIGVKVPTNTRSNGEEKTKNQH